MKVCDNCGNNLWDYAEVCPKCGKPCGQTLSGSTPPPINHDQKTSVLGVLALIFSCLGCVFIVGVILAIIDLCIDNEYKKTCSKIALGISGFWILVFILVGIAGNRNSSQEEIAEIPRYTAAPKPTPLLNISPVGEEYLVEQKPEPEKSANGILNVSSFSYRDMDVSYVKSVVEEDYFGGRCIVIYFDFTNNSDENQDFTYNFSVKAFQNGIELDGNYVHVNEETQNTSREIQPGTKITVGESFVTDDYTSPITVEVSPWLSLNDEKLAKFVVNF